MNINFDFEKKFTKARKIEFAKIIADIQSTMPIKVSSRGWGYLLEQAGYINKSQFDKVQNAINNLRKEGVIPVDFIAEEKSRMFSGVDEPSRYSFSSLVDLQIKRVLEGYTTYQGDYWKKEVYYIQCIVEKVDVFSLFEEVCREYHIPLANAKGWSSISQRAEFARRFKEAETDGKICVLLYCGDHDPDGLRISDTIRKNLEDISQIVWADGETGYDPSFLKIDRFGLEYDFIIKNGFTWIDNLMTGGDKELSSVTHRNHFMPYVQDYIEKVGVRKCEANVLITNFRVAEDLIRKTISKYLKPERTKKHYEELEEEIKNNYDKALDKREVDVSGIISKNNIIKVRNFLDLF